LGIQTVIDLTDETPEEKSYVEAQGMRYMNIAHCFRRTLAQRREIMDHVTRRGRLPFV
jgi:hypothetical protein